MLTHIGEFEHGRGQHQHYHWTALDWGKFPVSVLTQPSVLSKTLSRIHTFCMWSEDTPIWICESKLLTQSYLRHTFSSGKDSEITLRVKLCLFLELTDELTCNYEPDCIYWKSPPCHWRAQCLRTRTTIFFVLSSKDRNVINSNKIHTKKELFFVVKSSFIQQILISKLLSEYQGYTLIVMEILKCPSNETGAWRWLIPTLTQKLLMFTNMYHTDQNQNCFSIPLLKIKTK